jgi:BirA family biotin operon repressor/biotin-[acetyl-CoA-carboxylase] ligase
MEVPHATPSQDWRVTVVDETGSTNADLLALAALGEPEGTVLVARHQTSGRGRRGRRWDAPPGANLLMSVLFRSSLNVPQRLTQRMGLAVIETAGTLCGIDARLKWPNDAVVGDAKLAGILAEAGGPTGRLDHVVVGVGVNVRWAPPDGAKLGETCSVEAVRDAILDVLRMEPPDLTSRYRSALATLGRRVRVVQPHAVVTGIATDVTDDGLLVVVDDSGEVHELSVGDVMHLRHARDGQL